MQKALKRSFIVLVALVTMLFTCVLMPKQKAEAGLLLAGGLALGTAVAIGLIGYGIGVSSDDPEEDTYLAMACDKLTEYAAGQGINKWNLNHYLTNATWFWTAMAEVASWFYEQNLVMNETYETLVTGSVFLDGAGFCLSVPASSAGNIAEEVIIDSDKYTLAVNNAATYERELYFFLDASGDLHWFSNVAGSGVRQAYLYWYNSDTNDKQYLYFLRGGYETYTSADSTNWYYQSLSSYGTVLNFDAVEALKWFGVNLTVCSDAEMTALGFMESVIGGTLEPTGQLGIDFPTKLFESPADVLDITGSMESYKIDSTKDVINPADALELTELKTFDGLRDKLLEGDITADDVITSVGAQPYVLTDAETGEIATSDTPAERVKPVALEGDLTIPKDLVAEDTYTPTNTSTDSDKPKNRFNFPLSEFFPFCLPFDIYDFLTFFAADPVAPVIEIPIGEFFSSVPGVTEETTGYVMRLDLGEENFSKWFEILRLLESLGIIIGLIMVSRKLIHGGN